MHAENTLITVILCCMNNSILSNIRHTLPVRGLVVSTAFSFVVFNDYSYILSVRN